MLLLDSASMLLFTAVFLRPHLILELRLSVEYIPVDAAQFLSSEETQYSVNRRLQYIVPECFTE